jgi:hypothetical protein
MMIPVVKVKEMKSCLKPSNRQFPNVIPSADTKNAPQETLSNSQQKQRSVVEEHQRQDSRRDQATAEDADDAKLSAYKKTLSKLIRDRYNSEPYAPQTISNPVSAGSQQRRRRPTTGSEGRALADNDENAETIDNDDDNPDRVDQKSSARKPKQHVYGKHIDTLTAELLAVFSKEYNKSAFGERRGSKSEFDDLDDFIQVCEDREDSNTDAGTVHNAYDMADLFFDDDEDDDDDEEGEHDNEENVNNNNEEGNNQDEEDYYSYPEFNEYRELFCNTNLRAVNAVDATHEYVDYEDDRMILATNIKERDFSRDNIVMKICNELRAEIGQNRKLSKKMRRRLRMLEMFDVNRQKLEV